MFIIIKIAIYDLISAIPRLYNTKEKKHLFYYKRFTDA
jgi:hypothetical protein